MSRTLEEMKYVSSVDTADLNEEFAMRLTLALNDPRISDWTFILSAVRAYHEQAVLYQAYSQWLADPLEWALSHPNQTPPPLAAFPGTSNHERGLAVDLLVLDETNERWVLVATVLSEYGLWQAVRNTIGKVIERWHFELDPNRYAIPTAPIGDLEPASLPVPAPPAQDEEEEEMPPLARIYGTETYDAQFILYSNGAVSHLGTGEAVMYDENGPYKDVPKVTETDRVAYHRLVRRSGTNWLPSDMPY